jgi:hypothetical protein
MVMLGILYRQLMRKEDAFKMYVTIITNSQFKADSRSLSFKILLETLSKLEPIYTIIPVSEFMLSQMFEEDAE